ncbi:MAG: 50S ribosomal protein L9 [Bacteroidetes bacterium]|jgi:large subunit ribosomal protein L9|nr:50S ribosomal protein L9 [Bacteroidota bacterium]PHX83309.1 MAG: 50S ribosomal protein L9 [Flavobacteriales bacterium]
MEVILKQDVKNLGYKDDVVNVRPGFGRNFLIPKGMAITADVTAKKIHAENVKQRAHKEIKIKAEAEKNAAKLSGMIVKVGAKTGDNGKIFGSITSVQLTDAIKKLGFEIDRRNITIENEDTVKTIGTYKAKVRLHKEVVAAFDFEVISE